MKRYNITVNGTTYEVVVEEVGNSNPSAPIFTAPAPKIVSSTPKTAPSPAFAGANKVTAPMPGTVLDVKVAVGQSVKKGDVICVLEAMKMENDIPSPCDGVIAYINVQKGSTVAANDVLISIK